MSDVVNVKPGVIPVIFLEPYGSGFSEVLPRLGENAGVQVFECKSPSEALAVAREVEFSVVVFHAANVGELGKCIAFLKLLSPLIIRKKIRTILTAKFRTQDMQAKLSLYGCSEILIEPVTPKALLLKLERHLGLVKQVSEAVRSQREAERLENPAAGDQGTVEVAEAKPAKPAPPPSKKFVCRLAAPLEIKSDCWLLEGRKAQRIAGQWVIILTGPGPAVGRWMPYPPDDDRKQYWQWVPRDPENDPFIEEEGSWVFRGAIPKFKDGAWMFTGPLPELAFYYDGRSWGAKIRCDGLRTMIVARDSAAAIAKLPAIKKSLEVNIYLESENDRQRVGGANDLNYQGVGTSGRLSPLALAFLMSELIGKRGKTLAELGHRYCAYLSRALDGMRAELWVLRNSQWSCAGTSDSEEGRFASAVAKGADSAEIRVIRVDASSSEPVGCLAIGGAGVEQVSQEYLQAVSEISRGLLLPVSS